MSYKTFHLGFGPVNPSSIYFLMMIGVLPEIIQGDGLVCVCSAVILKFTLSWFWIVFCRTIGFCSLCHEIRNLKAAAKLHSVAKTSVELRPF
jgi:hypothetical protein